MGRHKIKLEKKTVISLYDKHRDAEKVGKLLGVSGRTIRKRLKSYGYAIPVGGRPDTKKKHYGCMVRWCREHPENPLPRNVKKITTLTGCSSDSVRSYLYRRRTEVRKAIKSLQPLPAYEEIILHGKNGQNLPLSYVEKFKVSFDKYNFTVKMVLKIKALKKHQVFTMPFESFKKLFRLNRKRPKG